MLTPPKWQTVWLKSHYSSENISRKRMFSNTADRIQDDLSKCCCSSSKELSLEALGCWRIWIENQQFDDWKLNETCYSAVRPLYIKKFHPLHKDSEVSEVRLCLMWLSLHKVQHLMHLEGPQHVLETFFQSCVAWLSCMDEINVHVQDLIFKLLKCLFSKDGEVILDNVRFPPLEGDLFKSKKFFSRLVNHFLEIFNNWTKVKEKNDLLFIWSCFLDQCEQSFKFIPVAVWHRIFKLVENICGDENESFSNKISMLHKCATLLKSVMSNSKFIDCGHVLTTPAEALLKILLELSLHNGDDEVDTHDMFKCCRDICNVLSKHIINAFGFDPCIIILSKIEDIEPKCVFWGFWCGITECFRESVGNLESEQYSKMELKLYRKLRAIAVNFDLDRIYLEERSVLMVEDQLRILRTPSICQYCFMCGRKAGDNEETPSESSSPSEVNEPSSDFSGIFGFVINHISPNRCKYAQDEPMDIDEDCYDAKVNRSQPTLRPVCSAEARWIKRKINTNKIMSTNGTHCDIIGDERLITLRREESVLFAPVYMSVILDEMCKVMRKRNDLWTHFYAQNVKKVQNSAEDGLIFNFMHLTVSLRGKTGVQFYDSTVRFWQCIDEIVYDLDFRKHLSKNAVTHVGLFMFLVNFMKNLFVIEKESNDIGNDVVAKVQTFMNKVICCKQHSSNSAFLESARDVVPKYSDNPIVVWLKFRNLMEKRKQSNGMHEWRGGDVINIFKYFEYEWNKIVAKNGQGNGKAKKAVVSASNVAKENPVCKESVEVVRNPPDVFSTLEFSQWIDNRLNVKETQQSQEPEVLYSIDSTPKRNKSRYSNPSRLSLNEKNTDNENRRLRKRISDVGKVGFEKSHDNVETTPKKSKKSHGIDSPCNCRKLKENLSPSNKNYSLRQRPLQRPSKFKDSKTVFPKRKSYNFDEGSLSPCRKCLENSFAENVHHKVEYDSTHTPEKKIEKKAKLDYGIDQDGVNAISDKDTAVNISEDVITDDKPDANLEEQIVELEPAIAEEPDEAICDKVQNVITENGESRTRGRKRPCENGDGYNALPKKFKMVEVQNCVETESDLIGIEEIKKESEEVAIPSSPSKALVEKLQIPVAQSRGSRILDLIPESPKIKRFQESPPSSKQQTVKPPNVVRNSRASKMLALLPDANTEVTCVEEPNGEKNSSTKEEVKALSGNSIVKMHHLLPNTNGSSVFSLSPKRSPIRQRKSIRFDDDRNETVTYYTDSPPCEVVREGRFKRIEK